MAVQIYKELPHLRLMRTYSPPGGDGHILQLVLPVVAKAWGFNCYHLKPNLQPENK